MATQIANVDEFTREVAGEIRRWRISSWLWGFGYILVILATIALPTIVSIEGLTDQFSWAGPLVPYLALITAVAAALNIALEAGPRWHAYMQDVNKGVSIRTRLIDDREVITVADKNDLRERWDALVDQHRAHRPGAGQLGGADV
jgi:hypothetical protein